MDQAATASEVSGTPAEYVAPHWLDEGQAAWPLLQIARGERSSLTAAAAQGILADWGELLSLVGEFAIKLRRLERAGIQVTDIDASASERNER